MSNIIRCPKCNRSLINEEFLSHSCQVVIKDIKYKWFVKTETDNYGEVIIIETIDGTLYRISPVLPPKNKHPFSTPDDETEPFNEIPPRVEYQLTPKGQELTESIMDLLHWMIKWSSK